MIRIETTATFDVEGHCIIDGRLNVPIPPGTHPIVIEVAESIAPDPLEVLDPMIQKVGNVYVLSGELLDDPERVRERIDEERTRQLLEGSFE